MALEIEKKFKVKKGAWRNEQGTKYRQGYLNTDKERTVRVRTMDDKGYLTVKGVSRGAVRVEYEYEIPKVDAEAMLDNLCEKPLIEKMRCKIEFKGLDVRGIDLQGISENADWREVDTGTRRRR